MAPESQDPSPAAPGEYACPRHPEISRDSPGICPICPNGCHLRLSARGDCRLELSGHGCGKGLAFVRTAFAGRQRIMVPKVSAGHTEDELRRVAALWGITVAALRPQLMPAGSPERALFRTVVQDDRGGLFVLERIPAAARRAKLRIISTLEHLSRNGLARITPYRADVQGRYIRRHCRGYWQLVPFVPGVPLNRGKYLYESWRAEPLSRFLIDLKEKSAGLPGFSQEGRFSIKEYIRNLLCRIGEHAPGLLPRLGRVIAFLEEDFMGIHDSLPVGFCHGDYHPLNVIWGRRDIRSVIDWEFSGIKPEIYDLANLLGCLGMEHPSSLTRGLVTELVGRLRASGIFANMSWDHLGQFIVALRFAWLAEWLRKDDRQMVALECDYLDLLVENHDRLARQWRAR